MLIEIKKKVKNIYILIFIIIIIFYKGLAPLSG
uniref:Uncharacterized protein n=1 Tax=viral metagenome TaxID=1070528 RepID=A0A6C0EHC0_9ZZZZ